jgi:Zn-dependent metalloprotease
MNLKINSLIVAGVLCFSEATAQVSALATPAKRWITENAKTLGIPTYSELNLSFVKKGNAGETLRFQQSINNVPVYQSEILLHYNKDGKITYTSSENLKREIAEIDTNATLSVSDALQKAHSASKTKGNITFEETNLFVYLTENNETKLVYRVLTKSYENPGTFETIVDAKNGDVISMKDIANYHHKSEEPKPIKKAAKTDTAPKTAFVTGSAYIFNPDPLSKMQVSYSGQYLDNNDATNASFDAARSLVTIPELDFTAGVYKLKGSYAEIKDIETPSTGLFTQSTDQFLFNRNQQGFEAVNVYWHVDNSLRYINETLNTPCKPLTNGGILTFDPHGLDGDDNSYYNNGQLVFGEGGVDDAEDADVVLHELGHGIHDWLTNGNLSQVQGLSEGCGDYWAQSYSRSLNQWPSSAPQYNWVFSWDGHNEYWEGRITNYTVLYPGSGTIHTHGQIWASSLMRIYNRIGKEKTDRAFLEGLEMTGSSTNQQQAAIAVRQAAIDMLGEHGFNCADITAFSQEFAAAGYTLPAYICNLAVDNTAINQIAIFPNPSSDVLNVTFNTNKEENAIVYNMEGRVVLEAKIGNGKSTINVSKLPKGSYILTLKESNVSSKFLKK